MVIRQGRLTLLFHFFRRTTIEKDTQLPIMNSVKPSVELMTALGSSIELNTKVSLRTPTGVVVHVFSL